MPKKFRIISPIDTPLFLFFLILDDRLRSGFNTFENRKKGFIVGISSVSGGRGRQKNYIYGSSKSGFTTYLSGLRNKLHSSGVHVMTVIPGYIRETEENTYLSSTPNYLAKSIFTSQQKRRDVIYVKWYWKYILFIVNIIPEFIFKRTNI